VRIGIDGEYSEPREERCVELCDKNARAHRYSLIHSGYFYSAFYSPLLLRGAPDYSIDTLSELARLRLTPQATSSEGLAQGSYMAARVGPEPTTEPRRLSSRFGAISYYFRSTYTSLPERQQHMRMRV